MSRMINRVKTRIRAYRHTSRYKQMLTDLNANFARDASRPGAEVVTLGDIAISAKSEEDYFILTEIYHNQSYNFDFRERTVVIDVGMNIGAASLFFASRPGVEHVYGFEPFITTYALAQDNFRRNPTLGAKITAHNFGLSHRNSTESLPYIEERKGSLGVNGLPHNFTPSRKDVRIDTIELREATAALRPIVDAHPNSAIALKIDCEGAEYDIVDNLAASSLLARFCPIMIEWHRRGPRELLSALNKCGHRTLILGDVPRTSGMLYGVK